MKKEFSRLIGKEKCVQTFRKKRSRKEWQLSSSNFCMHEITKNIFFLNSRQGKNFMLFEIFEICFGKSEKIFHKPLYFVEFGPLNFH